MSDVGRKIKLSACRYMILWAFIITIAVVGVVEILWLIKYGNTPQIYTDIVLEQLGAEFGNKSIELALYGIVVGLGIAIMMCLILGAKKAGIYLSVTETYWSDAKLICAGILLFVVGTYIFWGKLNINLIFICLIAFIAMRLSSNKVLEWVCLYILIVYAIFGIYRIYVALGGGFKLEAKYVSFVAFTCCSCILFFWGEKSLHRGLLISQLFVPFCLLIYLTGKYRYNSSIIVLYPPQIVYFVIGAFLLLSLLVVAFKIYNHWNGDNITQAISIFPSIAIMALNRFSGAGYVMKADMHHPAENTIAYNEVVNLGRSMFTEYVPVSGLYSFIQGWFLEIFGDGMHTLYSFANNFFYLAIIVITVIAIRLHLSSLLTLILATFIYITDYNRVVFILPFMLILLSKKLIERPGIWFVIWVLFGLGYGLYYPAYGVAIVGSCFPLGIYQIPRIISSFKRSRLKSKIVYSFMILLLATLIIACVPLLIGVAEHAINMSDGMMYMEGVTAFGKYTSQNFMGYLNHNDWRFTLQMILFYVVKFSIPAVVIWIGICAVINVFENKETVGGKRFLYKSSEALSMLAAFIFPAVCFYFSLYRIGTTLFSKASCIIVFSLIIIMILLYNDGKNNYNKYILLLICCFICALSDQCGMVALDEKYYTEYKVPEDYVYVEENLDMPNLGKGFVQEDIYNQIESAADKFATLDPDRNYFMLFTADYGDRMHGMAFDSILNIKGTALLEGMTVRGYSVTKATAKRLVESDTIVGNTIAPVDHYYLYKWLMTGGEYIWSEEERLFYPVEDETAEEIEKANSKAVMKMATTNSGRYAASLGNSIDTLGEVLTEVDLGCSVEEETDALLLEAESLMCGNDIDYIYLSADVGDDYTPFVFGGEHSANNRLDTLLMKHDYNKGLRCVMEWKSNSGNVHTMYSTAENGKLLLPIGAGTGWLNNKHAYIKIWFEQDEEKIALPEIKSLRLYRVRDIEI